MSADPLPVETAVSPWAGRRRRAEALRARHPFVAEVLTLYLALLPVQEDAWGAVRENPPRPEELARWAAERVLPGIVDATVAAGPEALREGTRSSLASGTAQEALAGWLAGAELDPVDRYVARASLAPALEALADRAGEACVPEREGDGEEAQLCPCCGGRPQLSHIASTGESLASGPRSLLCARCGSSWSCSRSVCPACGESQEARLSVFAERWEGPVSANGHGDGDGDGDGQAVFPHMRIASCSTCSSYLIEIDMARDVRAVPEVDELAALPLDLYAADQGLTKVTPNLMGF